MISLPPGVTISYDVIIQVSDINTEVINWWREIGGEVWNDKWFDARGRERIVPVIKYGTSKSSYKLQDGTDNYILRFKSQDAEVGLMFLMKFDKLVVSHNMKDIEKYVY